MANDQGVRYGAFPYNAPLGQPRILYFKVKTSATASMFRGQFVTLTDGGVVPTPVGDNKGSCGVAWEFLDTSYAGLPASITLLQNSVSGTSIGPFLPANTDAICGVIYDASQLYLMEEVTGGTAITTNSIGALVDFTYIATTGNTTTGFANSVVDNATLASASTGPLLQIMALENRLNADGTVNSTGNSAKWVVRIANHQLAAPSKLLVPFA